MPDAPTLTPDPVVEFYKQFVDREQIRRNLKLTVEERLLQLMEMQKSAVAAKRADRAKRFGGLEAIPELEALIEERER